VKLTAVALGFVAAFATAGTAAASYRLPSTASLEERAAYETHHTMINQYHPERAFGTMMAPDAPRMIRAQRSFISDGERNWFKQSSGEQYGGCSTDVSRPC
jgi:hypothetical protein